MSMSCSSHIPDMITFLCSNLSRLSIAKVCQVAIDVKTLSRQLASQSSQTILFNYPGLCSTPVGQKNLVDWVLASCLNDYFYIKAGFGFNRIQHKEKCVFESWIKKYLREISAQKTIQFLTLNCVLFNIYFYFNHFFL